MRMLLSAFCLAFLLATPGAAQELRPKLDDLVRHYAKVLFGSEYNPKLAKKAVSKWQGTVGITINGKPTQQLAAMTSKHLNTIAGLTKLKFKQIKPGTPMQRIDLIFMKRKHMTNINGLPGPFMSNIRQMAADPSMRCFFLSQSNAENRINYALVMVNIDMDPAHLNACLLEELSQVMGLPNDVDAYWPTIFQPIDTSTELSVWDRLYLKTLYDPRTKPGMKPVDAVFTAKGIFAEAMAKIP
ncbi:DUF2927 domain-containing protein [Magnetovibrio sp. PR-2]|uniref:DUF2927 domain-containing protein n=1 Tax=Magnetovibrio sp. PR-2 TaxID=3120356 RepID=UPI002FCE5E34